MENLHSIDWRPRRYPPRKFPPKRPAPKPTVPRLAQSYQPIATVSFDRTAYPAEVDSVVPSLHNVASCQGLFVNDVNFAADCACDIFEVRSSGTAWSYGLNSEKMRDFLEVGLCVLLSLTG